MKLLRKLTLLVSSCFFVSLGVQAQQMAGGEITYKCNGNNSYTVSLSLYAKCPNALLPVNPNVKFSSVSVNQTFPQVTLTKSGEAVPLKTCPGNTTKCDGGTGEYSDALMKQTYTGTFTLPSQQNNWVVEYFGTNRTNTLTNIETPNSTGPAMYLAAMINNTGNTCNSSVTFQAPPVAFVNSAQAISYDPKLANPNSSQVQVSLITPKITNQSLVSYKAPFSASQPVSTNGAFNLNASNGQINFTPSTQGEVSALTTEVKQISNGVVLGSAMREMYIQTLSAVTNPPTFDTPGDTLYSCIGEPYKTISGTAVQGNTADFIWENKAEWGVTDADLGIKYGIKTGQTATFSLVTGAFAGPFVRPIKLTLIDNKCGKVTRTYIMKYSNKPQISTTNNTVVNLLCLKPTEVKVDVTGGKPPYTYLWSPTNETTNPITITSAGTYSVVVTDANKCTATPSPWRRTYNSPINFVPGPILCLDSNITFYDVSSKPAIPTPKAPPAAPQPTTTSWTWNFGDNTPEVTGTSPFQPHKFAQAGTYSVTMKVSDGKGCDNSITKRIKVYSKSPVGFSFIDTCQVTEPSDLVAYFPQPVKGPNDTTIQNVRFYVDKAFRVFGSVGDNRLREPNTGVHEVRMEVTDRAGCVSNVIKTTNVKDRPKFLPTTTRDEYFYKCDSPGFPDTSFAFKGTAVGAALAKNKNLQVSVSKTTGGGFSATVASGDSIKVPHTIVQNLDQTITITIADVYGCKNDTIVNIYDPINPDISLSKYYCFLNDTLKLSDLEYSRKGYHWGLAKSAWDMKDGSIDTTLGSVAHSYSLKALDEALIRLSVEDKSSCKAFDTLTVYLSEPDPAQFTLSDTMACSARPVEVKGIRDNYINAWYYRYKDRPEAIFTTPERGPIYNNNFGRGVPSTIDDSIKNPSNNYIATTGIFYNERDYNKNFQTNPKVCSLTVSKSWKVIDTLKYAISKEYNHCYGSSKEFVAGPKASAPTTVKLIDTSWVWSLYSPSKQLLDTTWLKKGAATVYHPDSTLFNAVATSRPGNPNLTPYSVSATYYYTNDTITCSYTTPTLAVDNEKVSIDIDNAVPQSCTFYTNSYALNSFVFYESLVINGKQYDEPDSTVWDYGNGILTQGNTGGVSYDQPGVYQIKAYAKNFYGCKDTAYTKVEVLASPTAELKIDTVCEGLESLVDGSQSKASTVGSHINKYFWYYFLDSIPTSGSKPDTLLATKQTKNATYKEKFKAGSTLLGLVVVDSVTKCLGKSEIKQVVVNPIPKNLDFTATAIATNDQDYLGNEPIAFSPKDSNAAYREWRMGDGNKFEVHNSTGDTIYTYPYYAPPYPIEKNIYNVTYWVESAGGCIDSISKKIDVNAYFVLPNAFSPNEDGLHDQLISVGKGIKEIKEFKIFNRWGEEVYSVTGKPEKDAMKRGYLLWDGKYNGQVQPVGAYVYYAVVTTGYGNEIIKKGNLSLLR